MIRSAVALTAAGTLPAAVLAQPAWTPGAEIIGQPVQVVTNGTTNTVYLDPGGQLRIATPNGIMVPGTWTAANGQLCMGVGGATECVPYRGPFQAGQAQTLTSSCGATETWLAQSTNQPPMRGQRGERGR
ncbi:MAG TPA: hypothetical protein VNR86_04145 [Sphingomicrobium sp.]|nr:hypothetical protein [Sphingomicrobium sp.]